MSIPEAIRREAMSDAVSSCSPFRLRCPGAPFSLHAPRVEERMLRLRSTSAWQLLLATAIIGFSIGCFVA